MPTRSKRKAQKQKSRTGLVLPASLVALAPARALTSHLRHAYERRYRPQYRFASVIFVLDLFLLGVAVCLVYINLLLWFFLQPSGAMGLRVSLNAPKITASQVTPVELSVTAADGKWHRDVRLHWILPPSAEVLNYYPSPSAQGIVELGDIAPFADRHARALIRIRAQVGEEIPLKFSLQEGWAGRTVYGEDYKKVEAGSLRSELAYPAEMVSENGSLPLLIKNDGKNSVENLRLRLTKSEGAPEARIGGGMSASIPRLGAGSSTVLFIDIGKNLSSEINLAWQLEDGARIVAQSSVRLQSTSDQPHVEMTILNENELKVQSKEVSKTGLFLQQLVLLQEGESTVELPDTLALENVSLVFSRQEKMIFGPRTALPTKRDISFTVDVRYRTPAGDQIGTGPHPPQSDETTTYWVVWKLPPQNRPLRDLIVTGSFGPRVQPTGKCAAPVEATATTRERGVTWRIPELPPETSLELSCEIEVRPAKEDIGDSLVILDGTELTAKDIETRSPRSGSVKRVSLEEVVVP